MSLGSSADIIPFTRFLERRQRRQVAAVNSNLVMPPSTDAGSQPDGTEPRTLTTARRHRAAPVHAAIPHGGMARSETFGRDVSGTLVAGGALVGQEEMV